ncbi:MAG TPA: hypothetical protein VFF59_00315, partial [Anaerolineae bacterium]|nr:hypothetical protein [Anaerolineae bacterium]
PVADQAAAPAADEASDWTSSLRASASQPAESAEMPIESAPAEDVPDWLQSIGLPVTDQAVPPAADESADWMSSLRVTASQPTESAETPIESAPAEDVPDWLRDPGATQTQPVALTEQQAETPVAEEGPDWLRAFDASPSEPAASVPSTIESAPAEVPDWLRDIGATAAAQPPAVESDDLPDWLRDTGAATQPADTPAVPTFDLSAEAEPAAETPDWLSNLQPPIKTGPAASESSKSETTASPAMAAAAGLGTAGPIGVDKTPERDLPAAELPDWLKSLREGQPAAFIPSAEPMSGLLQAEIPTWLEALRPKEGQAGSLADLPAESEQEGVFAGLANILPPLSDLTETSAATPVTTVTSADDLARAGIFQELLSRPISQPTLVAALPAQSRQGQGRLLQWVIALLLVAVIVAPFLMPQGWLPFLPHADNLPPSPLVQSAVTKITILPPNASVLVVFDYDPTQAGEMNQIAEMVLRHLQTRAANVTAVSLNPLGADLALSVWSAIGAPTGGRRINLGYVPGQAIGVQNVLLNNGPFSLVIDLSASSDSVRWWVEQLAVSGFDVPFIAGVSAAVESLALPYAQSGQITGLISGATGAMMYARQANLLPSLEEAQQAMLMAEQTQQPPSPEVVLMVRNQYHIESQTLAHWLLAVLIIMGLVS